MNHNILVEGATSSSHESHHPIMGASFSGAPLAAPTPPTPTAPPVVSGDGTPGSTLSCTPGDWEFEPTSYTYQWQSDSLVNIGTGERHRGFPTSAARSAHLLTATNSSGYSTSRSNGVAIIDARPEAQSTPPLYPSR
jgi:hypothetical protein